MGGRFGYFAVAGFVATVGCSAAAGAPAPDGAPSSQQASVDDVIAFGDSALGVACGLPAVGPTGVPKPRGVAGNLKILNWAGFKGAVSYTFDDANSSQIAHYAELKALAVPMSFYLITGKTEASNPVWAQAVADGHELGNHTKTHNSTAMAADIDAATQFLQSQFGVTVWTMAAPNGSASYIPFAKDRFLLNRGVAGGSIAPNGGSDPFNLPCFIPPAGASASAFNAQIDAARSAGNWQVVLVHGFTGGTDGAYQPVAIGEFVSGVQHAKAFGNLWIGTMLKVGAYFRGQKLLSSVTPTVSGSTRTWKWTLPAHFPPSQCLRVKVDGGTLKQGGQALVWDSHGYYEVALDAGSLTLSP